MDLYEFCEASWFVKSLRGRLRRAGIKQWGVIRNVDFSSAERFRFLRAHSSLSGLDNHLGPCFVPRIPNVVVPWEERASLKLPCGENFPSLRGFVKQIFVLDLSLFCLSRPPAAAAGCRTVATSAYGGRRLFFVDESAR